jgi:hypothetical protein
VFIRLAVTASNLFQFVVGFQKGVKLASALRGLKMEAVGRGEWFTGSTDLR